MLQRAGTKTLFELHVLHGGVWGGGGAKGGGVQVIITLLSPDT